MPNRKTAHTTPTVQGGLVSRPVPTALGTFYHTIAVGSADWFQWLGSDCTVFSYTLNGVTFTVRNDGGYWVAFKKINGRLTKRYIGVARKVTAQALDRVAAFFSGKSSSINLTSGDKSKQEKANE